LVLALTHLLLLLLLVHVDVCIAPLAACLDATACILQVLFEGILRVVAEAIEVGFTLAVLLVRSVDARVVGMGVGGVIALESLGDVWWTLLRGSCCCIGRLYLAEGVGVKLAGLLDCLLRLRKGRGTRVVMCSRWRRGS
jgi:hypothetical protein